MALASYAVATIAGASALAAYVDAKFHLSQDLRLLLHRRQSEKWYLENEKKNRLCLWYPFCNNVKRFANDTCLWSREGIFTWQQVHDRAAQYSQFFLSKGIKPGDTVAFYLQNSPDFLIAWLALFAIGCAPAMINFNLASGSLIHCLKLSRFKILLVDEDEKCQHRIDQSRQVIEDELGMSIIVLDDKIKNAIALLLPEVPGDESRQEVKGSSPSCIIYTSGTTGLPKGCESSVQRIWSLGNQMQPSFGQKPGPGGDRWYVCMPMYHGTGGLTAMICMMGGISLAIGKRFSVSTFWNDIHDSQSTFFVYVGETARYLLNAPYSPLERNHPRLRCMYGNGLRPDVWQRFRQRFDVPEIAEFFNSTEGLLVLLNYNRGEYTANCVGHHGLLFRRTMHNVYVPVAIDPETNDIYRDPVTGFAKRKPYGAGGEIIVAIPNERAFPGYVGNETATQKKIVRDVFRKGDLFYRSGDALRRDDDGRWYFLDRLGDTFRWKSENVSTAEVAEVLGRFPGVAEANVYGVAVPHHDGRAGCVALLVSSGVKIDYDSLFAHARANLPKYAVPVFIRLVSKSNSIHNNKQHKVPLRDEGVDLDKLGTKVVGGQDDTFLWVPPKGDRYIKFDKTDWGQLQSGKIVL